jgi:hypothetical protein
MDMSQGSTTFQPNRSELRAVAQADAAAIYTHPEDVGSDPKLTTAEKRAVLASWVSDARADENAPALRRLDSGAIVEIDAILRVLASLDERAPDPRADRKPPPPFRRRRRVIARWLNRGGPPNSSNDDDDDPPPAPAGFGIPFRPTFVEAHGICPEQLRGLACVTG